MGLSQAHNTLLKTFHHAELAALINCPVHHKASGWSPKFYNEHRKDIEAHKKAQAVYSSVDGKMPTLKELSAEYDALKAEKENDDAALEELKPQLTTLNHIKYNFDVLERDYLPEEQDLRRDEHQER